MNDRSKYIEPFVSQEDDSIIICKCECITKGEIREKVHSGLYTMKEIRKFLRTGMGPCQGKRCRPLVREIIRDVLGALPEDESLELKRTSIKAMKMSAIIEARKETTDESRD